MPRFFLHLRNHVDEVIDPEGVQLPGLAELKRAVVAAARDIMVGDLKNGLLDFRYRIDAEDGHGAVVYSLPFRHAVDLIPA